MLLDMSDDSHGEISFKSHMSEFERIDKLTFYAFVAGFVVWYFSYASGMGLTDFLFASAAPMALVGFAASRRWSALLRFGPAAPVKE